MPQHVAAHHITEYCPEPLQSLQCLCRKITQASLPTCPNALAVIAWSCADALRVALSTSGVPAIVWSAVAPASNALQAVVLNSCKAADDPLCAAVQLCLGCSAP